jgi:hypothetical protein
MSGEYPYCSVLARSSHDRDRDRARSARLRPTLVGLVEEVAMEMSFLAAELITQHVQSRNTPGAGFRIRRDDDDSVADGLKVGYARSPQPGDAVISRGEARVFVDEGAEPLVAALTLDAKKVGTAYQLVLHESVI